MCFEVVRYILEQSGFREDRGSRVKLLFVSRRLYTVSRPDVRNNYYREMRWPINSYRAKTNVPHPSSQQHLQQMPRWQKAVVKSSGVVKTVRDDRAGNKTPLVSAFNSYTKTTRLQSSRSYHRSLSCPPHHSPMPPSSLQVPETTRRDQPSSGTSFK